MEIERIFCRSCFTFQAKQVLIYVGGSNQETQQQQSNVWKLGEILQNLFHILGYRCLCRGALTSKFQPKRFLKSRFLLAGCYCIGTCGKQAKKLLQLTSLSAPTCIRTAKFVRWLQVHVISVLVLLTIEHPLLDQEPLNFDLKYSFGQ